MLLDLIRHIGGQVVATVGHSDKVPILNHRGLSRDQIIVRGTDDTHGFENAVRKQFHGDGVDVVIDPVMGNYFDPGWRLLNRGGRYILMGSSSVVPSRSLRMRKIGTAASKAWRQIRRPKLDLLTFSNQNRTLSALNIGALFSCSDLLRDGFEELAQMDLRRPLVSKTFEFSGLIEAMQAFQAGFAAGKIVVLVDVEQHQLRR